MKFLPRENIIYKSKLREEEIIRRLTHSIGPEKGFSFGMSGSSTKPYEGKINGQTFDIKRTINYRNSFLPRINGFIQRDFDGISIKVNMRLHILIIVFLSIWCGLVGFVCLGLLAQFFIHLKFNPAALIPFGMLLFAYVLTMVAFKFESSKSKKDLQTLFEAEPIEA